jgi:hypothetical protein
MNGLHMSWRHDELHVAELSCVPSPVGKLEGKLICHTNT